LVSNSTRATYLPNTILVNLPSILTRLATFAAFAIVAKIKGSNSINTSLVITSLAILDLLGNPLSELLYKDVLLTIVVGSVGCGKSTFLKGLLGETPVFGGSVHVETPEIAFCDQSPWIANA
jgi:ABC-type transport system involved in cytochrome bd biosynthesis fused ATPase/permease subunit